MAGCQDCTGRKSLQLCSRPKELEPHMGPKVCTFIKLSAAPWAHEALRGNQELTKLPVVPYGFRKLPLGPRELTKLPMVPLSTRASEPQAQKRCLVKWSSIWSTLCQIHLRHIKNVLLRTASLKLDKAKYS